jgi:hypothetical protein
MYCMYVLLSLPAFSFSETNHKCLFCVKAGFSSTWDLNLITTVSVSGDWVYRACHTCREQGSNNMQLEEG